MNVFVQDSSYEIGYLKEVQKFIISQRVHYIKNNHKTIFYILGKKTVKHFVKAYLIINIFLDNLSLLIQNSINKSLKKI